MYFEQLTPAQQFILNLLQAVPGGISAAEKEELSQMAMLPDLDEQIREHSEKCKHYAKKLAKVREAKCSQKNKRINFYKGRPTFHKRKGNLIAKLSSLYEIHNRRAGRLLLAYHCVFTQRHADVRVTQDTIDQF